MSDKYIINNCPNLTTSYYSTGEIIFNQCGLTDDDLCKNCPDCLLKQIVEKCKKAQYECKTCECFDTHFVCLGEKIFAEKILSLLDIQEVE